jgi:hypothetical protein
MLAAMKLEQLTEVFVKHVGARKDGNTYLVPADAEATLYAALEGETLSVARITRLEVDGQLVHVETAKHERFVLAGEDIRAVKIEKSDQGRRERSAGFGK